MRRVWIAILVMVSHVACAITATSMLLGGAQITTATGGATLVFNCTAFNVAGCNSSSISTAASASFNASSPYQIIINNGTHSAGAMWYQAQQNIATGWTTDFTFQIKPDVISSESYGTGNGTTGPYTHTTAENNVLPNTVTITAGAITGTDNGSGQITGTGIASGTIDYPSGTVSITFSSVLANATAITIAYQASGNGMTFVVQNTNSTTNPAACCTSLSSDANGLGYGSYWQTLGPGNSQYQVPNSIGVKFDDTNLNDQSWIGVTPSTTGLYMNGAPDMSIGYSPAEDISATSVVPAKGNVMSVHMVYDGSNLTMVEHDTTTGAQVREVWPLALGTTIGSSSAWIGLMGGTVTPAVQQVLSWDFYEGYNSRLSTPTISPAAGQYSTSQSVTIGCPSGATCYYTTNGELPTSASTQYTGAITVSASEVVSAVAIESGYTDSNVAQANYQIQASGPVINFPSGFGSASNLIAVNGSAAISGSNLVITDATNHPSYGEAGGAWYVVPVSVSSFSTTFTIQLPAGTNTGDGFAFVIQNKLPSSQDANNATSGPFVVSGGPHAVAYSQGLGYSGILSSIAVAFNLYPNGASGSQVGLFQDGANPASCSGCTDVSSKINFHSSTPISATLSYSSGTLSLSLTQGSNSYGPINWTVNVPTVVGGNTAYVGFTGGTEYGGVTALQEITNWTM